MTAPVDVAKVRDEMAKALDGVTLTPRGALIYPADFVHLSVRFLVDHGPALLAAYEAVQGAKTRDQVNGWVWGFVDGTKEGQRVALVPLDLGGA